MIKSFLNHEGHQNPISGSKVTTILLKMLIWPIGEASAGEGLRLKPAQQACFYWDKQSGINYDLDNFLRFFLK